MMYDFVKRLFDIVISLVGIVFLIPISVIIKILFILNKDYKSIFYFHERIGKNGRKFKLIKFRTMVYNSNELLCELLKDPSIRFEYECSYKIKNDPRITKIGRFLRKFSLDELPQFINVLFGDMSIVGPRPVIERELIKYKKHKDIFLSVRPGLTGNWVINGRSNITYEQRIDYEIEYINNRNFIFDIKILFYTVICVLKGDGAC